MRHRTVTSVTWALALSLGGLAACAGGDEVATDVGSAQDVSTAFVTTDVPERASPDTTAPTDIVASPDTTAPVDIATPVDIAALGAATRAAISASSTDASIRGSSPCTLTTISSSSVAATSASRSVPVGWVGLVRTTDNFGVTGETPSHPELLDYLATRLKTNDWSTKQLIRDLG